MAGTPAVAGAGVTGGMAGNPSGSGAGLLAGTAAAIMPGTIGGTRLSGGTSRAGAPAGAPFAAPAIAHGGIAPPPLFPAPNASGAPAGLAPSGGSSGLGGGADAAAARNGFGNEWSGGVVWRFMTGGVASGFGGGSAAPASAEIWSGGAAGAGSLLAGGADRLPSSGKPPPGTRVPDPDASSAARPGGLTTANGEAITGRFPAGSSGSLTKAGGASSVCGGSGNRFAVAGSATTGTGWRPAPSRRLPPPDAPQYMHLQFFRNSTSHATLAR